jgi:predicted permease
MSLWSRVTNVWRGDRLSAEIDDELEAHVEEAIAQGRDPAEARRALGSKLRQRESSHDVRVVPWLDSLRADLIFGWRQILRRKVTSAAAILSLALAIGACTSAFRLIDALLLRPLPVQRPEQLYAVVRVGTDFDGRPASVADWAYPSFQLMRAAAKGQAELLAVSDVELVDLTYKSDQEIEKAHLQYVSGGMFPSFGLQPVLGRLLTENDDLKPGAHPYAVISYDYWARRFGRDPKIVGRTFQMGERLYQIIGVGPESFTGTETGTVTDIFVPSMMHPGATRDDWTWHRTLARVRPGVGLEPLRAKLNATSLAFERERAKGFTGMSQESIDRYLSQTVELQPAAAGASNLQKEYRRSLLILGCLVALVLLIACANVANLMTAQAASRAREMALRVSIGAGRWRLVQLVLVESGLLAFLAAAIGCLFAWWSAPFVVSRINPPDNPARLLLPADWRVVGFGVALTLAVMLLFGLVPALRASSVKPASALKGGEDPHSRRRLMHALIGAQVAFCFLVLFAAGLFVATFQRLSHRNLGFAPEGLLAVTAVAHRPQPDALWEQVSEHLRQMPGVQSVALAGWPLLNGNAWNRFVSVNGAPPGPELAYLLNISPGWIDTMKMHLVAGRDLRPSDTFPGMVIVNETFVKEFFHRDNPIGQSIATGQDHAVVVGVVKDAPYRSIKEPILPVAYVPFHVVDGKGVLQPVHDAAFIVRTANVNPLVLASMLRNEVPRARPEFRVSNIRTQTGLVQAQTIRERLLAALGLFFATVALLLAGVGLYGVLDYSVLQRRREIGIRIAIGAQPAGLARLVTVNVFTMVLVGAVVGLALGLVSMRFIESLFYGVKATDAGMLALPCLSILVLALLAAGPAVIRAVRTDPMQMLRCE